MIFTRSEICQNNNELMDELGIFASLSINEKDFMNHKNMINYKYVYSFIHYFIIIYLIFLLY